ncbi:MAG TPA: T9SS type A sorting domain-containing protein [Candidatus Kryptonia bacterium]
MKTIINLVRVMIIMLAVSECARAQCDNCPPPQVVIYGMQLNVPIPSPDDSTTGSYTTTASQQAFLNWVALGDVFVPLSGIANNDPEANCVRWSQGSLANQLATLPDSLVRIHLQNYWTGDVPDTGALGGVDYLIRATMDSSGGAYHFHVYLEDGYTRERIATGSADFSGASGAVGAANTAIASIEPVFDKIREYQTNLRNMTSNMALSAQITIAPSQADMHILQSIPVTFEVTDCDGTPLNGFTLNIGGSEGSFDQSSVVTDQSGQATANFTAGSSPGVANLTAVCYPYTTPMHKQRGSHGDAVVTIDNPGLLIWQYTITESEDQSYLYYFDSTDNVGTRTYEYEQQQIKTSGNYRQYVLGTITDSSIDARAVYGGSGDLTLFNTDKTLEDISAYDGGGSMTNRFSVTTGWVASDENYKDDLDLDYYRLPGQPPTFYFATQVKWDGQSTGNQYYLVKPVPSENEPGYSNSGSGSNPITDGFGLYLTEFQSYPPSTQVTSSFSGSGTSYHFSGNYHVDSTYDVSPSGQKRAIYNAMISVGISPYQLPTAVKSASDNLPKTFHLYPNYPNPFNPSTMIFYDVPTTSIVSLTVYDLLGRKVETLINQRQSPGKYGVRFDASRLASGVYFYRLQAGGFSQTKKLMLVK